MNSLPAVKLKQGIHVMHLFYRIDRFRWSQLPAGESAAARERLEALCAASSATSHPRLCTYAPVGGKADLAFILYAADLGELAQMHRRPDVTVGVLGKRGDVIVGISPIGMEQPHEKG